MLCMAQDGQQWVIFDQEENIMVATHIVHYGQLYNSVNYKIIHY